MKHHALLTDVYQLSMLRAYWEHGMDGQAVFDLFVRRLRPERNFLVAAGLAQALDYLENVRFAPDELEWLAERPHYPPAFIEWMARLRFTGDVEAMPEGTVFFPEEPVLRVTAPLPEAQLVETRLISLVNYSSLVASKAARFVLAAPDARLVDFGLRRAHGAEAGLLAARSAYIAGFAGTATAAAAQRWGIPPYGTMAHSFVQAHESEAEAFLRFARAFPEDVTLLIDTYDTEAGARTVTRVARQLRAEGIEVRAVRLDSGDLAAHARNARRILDEGGCPEVRIFASSSLDEHDVARLSGAPIDGFGVGSGLTVSTDAPILDTVYKLQEYDGQPRRKRSEGKATWPGRKQVFREADGDGILRSDALALEDEDMPGQPLLIPVMRSGARVAPDPALVEIRSRARESLASLPPALRSLESARPPYVVKLSPGVRALTSAADERS